MWLVWHQGEGGLSCARWLEFTQRNHQNFNLCIRDAQQVIKFMYFLSSPRSFIIFSKPTTWIGIRVLVHTGRPGN
jgi:hypothetical protein